MNDSLKKLNTDLELVVVMPVFNEEEALPLVIHEWLPVLRQIKIRFQILVVDDGSTDATPSVLQSLLEKFPNELSVIRHPNQGHGQSCIRGYELAVQSGGEWILQIDSDGQCDPSELPKFWAAKSVQQPVFGTRVWRDDGLIRYLISYVVCVVVFLATGCWIRDPNVPYRLMPNDLLANAIKGFPQSIYLANIGLSVRLKRLSGISWLPIHFRKRHAGQPKVRLLQFAKHGVLLFKHLRRID